MEQITQEQTAAAPSVEEFRHNGHVPEVLVVGMAQADNGFLRAVEQYGLKAVHHPWDGPGEAPLLDAAIIITTYSGHGLMWKIKDQYKAAGRRVFFADVGFSQIKEEFEQYFFGTLRRLLANAKWSHRLYYMTGHFFKEPGTKFKKKELVLKVRRQYPELKETQVDGWLAKAVGNGTLERLDDNGSYRFNGITDKALTALFSAGLDIPASWRYVEPAQAEETPSGGEGGGDAAEAPAADESRYDLVLMETMLNEVSELGNMIRSMKARTDRDALRKRIHAKLEMLPVEKLAALDDLLGGSL